MRKKDHDEEIDLLKCITAKIKEMHEEKQKKKLDKLFKRILKEMQGISKLTKEERA